LRSFVDARTNGEVAPIPAIGASPVKPPGLLSQSLLSSKCGYAALSMMFDGD
jgi:hypothetical protein